MDGGAWKAAVHGVAEGWTQLSNFTFMHWRRKWQPTPVFLPGESRRQRGLVGYSPWGRKDSDTTETAWHTCMMLTLACLQKGFVRSLFLVVRSESLKDPKETV